MSVMTISSAHFTGSLIATCPDCKTVCVYWDEDDLNEQGNLECHCEESLE